MVTAMMMVMVWVWIVWGDFTTRIPRIMAWLEVETRDLIGYG